MPTSSSAKLLLCVLLGAAALAGCSSDPKTDSTSSSSTAAQSSLTLGEKTEKSQLVVLDNKTGFDITSVFLQAAEMSSNPVNLVPEGKTWAKDTRADLYIDSFNQEQEAVTFTIKYKDGEDEKELSILKFPVKDLTSDANLTIDNGELVLNWTKDGKAMSTKEGQNDAASSSQAAAQSDETAPAENGDAANTAPADEGALVQDPAYQEPVYQEPVYESPVYNEPVYEQPVYEQPVEEQPSYSTPTAPSDPDVPAQPAPADPGTDVPAQGDENCVNPGDIVLNPGA